MNEYSSLSRRRFMQTAGTAAAGAWAAVQRSGRGKEDDSMLIIDCHAHIYGEDEKKYPTIDRPYRPPKGKGTVAHLKREMRASGAKWHLLLDLICKREATHCILLSQQQERQCCGRWFGTFKIPP